MEASHYRHKACQNWQRPMPAMAKLARFISRRHYFYVHNRAILPRFMVPEPWPVFAVNYFMNNWKKLHPNFFSQTFKTFLLQRSWSKYICKAFTSCVRCYKTFTGLTYLRTIGFWMKQTRLSWVQYLFINAQGRVFIHEILCLVH